MRKLAEPAGLSAAYIGQLESGYDERTGKRLEPHPRLLGMLARALAEGDGAREMQYYRAMIDLAGYLPHDYYPELFEPDSVPAVFTQAFGGDGEETWSAGAIAFRSFVQRQLGLSPSQADVLLDVAASLRRNQPSG